MAVVISSGGISKTYRYYPYDAFYIDANGNVNTNGDGQQVKEAWFNGVKYYPTLEEGTPTKRMVIGGSWSAVINAHFNRNANSYGDIQFPVSVDYEAVISSNNTHNLVIADEEIQTGIVQMECTAKSSSKYGRSVSPSSYSPSTLTSHHKVVMMDDCSKPKYLTHGVIYHLRIGAISFSEGKPLTLPSVDNIIEHSLDSYTEIVIYSGLYTNSIKCFYFQWGIKSYAVPQPDTYSDVMMLDASLYAPIMYAYNIPDDSNYRPYVD